MTKIMLSLAFSILLLVQSKVIAANSKAAIVMNCKQVMTEWAFERQTQRIFASPLRGGEIVEFGVDTGNELRRIPLKSYPSKMLIKPRRLFVCSNHGLQVIDLKSNKLEKFMTQIYGASAITSPTLESKHAYLFGRRSRQHREQELVLLDTSTLKVLSRQPWRSQTKRQTPSRFIISRDESELLSCGLVNPRIVVHQGRAYRLSKKDLRLSLPREVTIPALPIYQTDRSARWLAGNIMLSSDLEHTLREYEGDLVAFDELRDRFAALTIEDRSSANPDMILSVGKISSNQELARITLTAQEGVSPEVRLKQSYRTLVFPSIQFDNSGQYVLCAYASSCHVVDTQKMGLQISAPPLELKPIVATRYAAGRPIAIDLQTKGDQREVEPTISLTDAPTGVRIEDAQLLWNPTFADIGRHDVHLKISTKGQEIAHVLSLVIVLPEIGLPIAAQAMIADEVGKYAVVFGQTKDEATTSSTRYRPPSQLAVVDLAQLKTVNQFSVDDWPRSNLISGKYLLWIPKSVDVLKRIDLEQGMEVEDLAVAEGKIEEIFLIGEEAVAVILANEQARTAKVVVYNISDWRMIKDHPLSQLTLRWSPRSVRSNLRQLGDSQLYFYNRVLNAKDGSTLCFNTRLGSIANRIHRVSEKDFIAINNRGSYGTAWGIEIGSRKIARLQDPAAIIYYTSKTHQLSRSRPLYVSLETEKRGNNHCFMIELRDLVFGKSLGKFPLPDDVNYRPGFSHALRFVRISGDKIICTVGNRLFYYAIPEISEELQPLRMLYPKLPPTSVTKSMTIPLAARGGKAPYQFRLGQPIDGVAVASSTGVLKVNWPKLWENFKSSIAEGQRHEVTVGGVHPSIGPRFDQATGIIVPDGKLPVSVECLLAVSDASGQQNHILVSLVGIASQEELSPAIEKGKRIINEKRAKARELYNRQQQQARPAQAKDP